MIVMAEVPGITPNVAAFARRVAAIGCTAVMPHLFGRPGKDPLAGGRLAHHRLRAVDTRAAVREPGVHDVGDEPHVAGDRVAARPGRPRARALRRAGRRRGRDVLHRRLRPGDGHPSEPARAGALATVDADADDEGPAGVDRLLGRRPRRREGPLRRRGADRARPALQGRHVRAGAALHVPPRAARRRVRRRRARGRGGEPGRRHGAALGADRAPHRRARAADPRSPSTRSSTSSAPACSRQRDCAGAQRSRPSLLALGRLVVCCECARADGSR